MIFFLILFQGLKTKKEGYKKYIKERRKKAQISIPRNEAKGS